jgi:hypothetical protein
MHRRLLVGDPGNMQDSTFTAWSAGSRSMSRNQREHRSGVL